MSKSICERCGEYRRVAVRQPNGDALCCQCHSATNKEVCAQCGNLRRVTVRLPDGGAQCPRCYAKEHAARCDECGRIRTVASRVGRVLCHTCWTNLSPNRVYAVYRNAAKRKGRDFLISADEFANVWRDNCTYCGERPGRMGVDRIDSALGYVPGNITACCFVCNRMKSDLSVEEFEAHVAKVHKKFQQPAVALALVKESV